MPEAPDSGHAAAPASSFGSKRSGWRDGAGERRERRCDVQPTPARVRVAARAGTDGSRCSRSRRSPSARGSSITWSGVRAGSTESSIAAAAVTCGAANDVPFGGAVVLGPAARVALVGAAGELRSQLQRQGREDRLPGRRDVVEDRVTVREVRDRAVLRERAHADHVRERGRVAGEVPRLARRLVAVPDRGDDDDVVRDRVGDGLGLRLRVRVARGMQRIADPAEAHVDHARALVDGPPDRLRLGRRSGIVRCGVTTLATISCAAGNSPAMPMPSSTVAPIRPATNVPCPCVSTVALPPTKLRAATMCFASSGCAAVDPRVDDRDLHRRERRQLRPGVVGVVRRQVPLLRRERIGRRERCRRVRRERARPRPPRRCGGASGLRPDHRNREHRAGEPRGGEPIRRRLGRMHHGRKRTGGVHAQAAARPASRSRPARAARARGLSASRATPVRRRATARRSSPSAG